MKTLNTEEQAKVKHVIESGIKVKQEVKDLSEGLRDTVKAVAEEAKKDGSDFIIVPSHKKNNTDNFGVNFDHSNFIGLLN